MSEKPLQPFELGRMKSIGVESCDQVLLWLPYRHDDFTRFSEDINLFGGVQCVQVIVLDAPEADKHNKHKTTLRVTDGNIAATISAFGGAYEWRKIQKDDRIYLTCEPQQFGSVLYLKNAKVVHPYHVGKVVPRYRAKKGVVSEATIFEKSNLALRFSLEATVDHIMAQFQGASAEAVESACGISSIAETLRSAHAPASMEDASAALDDLMRLAAYEHVYRCQRLRQARHQEDASALNVTVESMNKLVGMLKFRITDDQKRAIVEIVKDLKSDLPMRRLLSGDVGTGKTAAFLLPAAAARLAGARVAIIAPNDLLVTQIAGEARAFFGCPVVTVSGKDKLKKCNLDDNPIVVGTIGIATQAKKMGIGFDLVIADEQQKFSRDQRDMMLAPHTNLLESTATCIPRTMALVTHGGMDISTLNTCPVKKRVMSRLLDISSREWLFSKLKAAVSASLKCVIVYPSVETKDKENEKKSVEGAFAMWDKQFPGRVAMLHGRLSDEEKREVIARFKDGSVNLIISTSIIEIGVTLPSLAIMTIMSPDRFGSSSLHQFRGRLARNGGDGAFLMYLQQDVSEMDEDTVARLKCVEETADGFALAEKDMELRGFGDMAGDADDQSGIAHSLFFRIRIKPSDIRKFAEGAHLDVSDAPQFK